jgi:tetratricopeptide (TPR) repeat protein
VSAGDFHIQAPRPALALLLVTPALFSCRGAPDLALGQKFQAAQQAFDKAQAPEDFLQAASLYQEIRDAGLVSGAVLYNQGNAFMRAGQRGRAIACYRQAQRYRPRDPYLDHNLRYALGANAAEPKRAVFDYLLFWQNWLSYGGKFRLLGSAALVAFASAIAAVFLPHRRRWLPLLGVGVAFTLICGLSAAYDWYRFDVLQHGVLTADGVIARKGNAESYEPAFTQPLSEGTEFQVLERRAAWLLIRLPGAKEGWVPAERTVVY